MDKSGERDETATAIEVELTPRRNVRRKLVQSTLVPPKSAAVIESNEECMTNAGNKEEEGQIGDGNICSSQGKRGRKPKEKTPKSKTSKKLAKEKSPAKSTPKKSATRNGTVAATSQVVVANVSPPIPNLRLEAKLRAEEDSRMFVGKQIHPFFSSWKGGKKNQEAAEAENGRCRGHGRDEVVTVGPIHVFERFQDVDRSIDWKNWTFFDQASTIRSPDQQIKFNSLEQRPKKFDLNELPTPSHPDVCIDEETKQCVSQSDNIVEASSLVLDGAETADCEVHKAVILPSRAGGAAEFSNEVQSISCRESDQLRNSLWVDKYQPRSASEVCGNTKSVKLMNEWMCLWHERVFQPSKDYLSNDEERSQDASDNCYESGTDSENIGVGERLKNVLLIVGPVGSGKSAAIYACAKEQGFKILESNASECRNGAVVRQKFGEALKSHSLQRSLDPLFNSCTDGRAVEDAIEVASLLNIQNDRANLKPLILFEDVDICFAEDRGLFSAIQQIAEKAKGPVVLTANDKNHGIPDNLDRIEICFSLPSSEELFSHLSSVCAAEDVKVDSGSLKQLTMFSGGDIRKAISQLQFWFQSKGSKRARKAKNTGGPNLFDHEAGHKLLPQIISRDFPSQLSQLVESEISKSLSKAAEGYTTVEVFIEEVENDRMFNRLWKCDTEKNSIEAKKAAMLRQNTYFDDSDELEEFLSTPRELSNTSYRPLSSSRPNRRRKFNVVMSSDSEDEPLSDIQVSISRDLDKLAVHDNDPLFSFCREVQNGTSLPLPVTSGPVRTEIPEQSHQYEASKLSCINEVSESVDVSCVPESSIVPETQMDSEGEISIRAVSCGHFDGQVEVSMSENVVQKPLSNGTHADRSQIPDYLTNTYEIIASSDGIVMEDCVKEYVGTFQRMQQVTDECSRIDFDKISKITQKSKCDNNSRDSVQESWKKICSIHADFKAFLDSEPVEAPQVLDLTHQVTNLISEADLTHSRRQNLESLEPLMNASGDLDTSNLSHVLEQMTSSVAQQGFCYFTNQIALTGSVPSTVDEARQDCTSSSETCLDMKRERMVRLSGILESVIPPKSYSALRGEAFHEYISCIGQISRAEPISGAMENRRRRRSREVRHYLSSGSLDLSPEDIAYLGEHTTYRRNE